MVSTRAHISSLLMFIGHFMKYMWFLQQTTGNKLRQRNLIKRFKHRLLTTGSWGRSRGQVLSLTSPLVLISELDNARIVTSDLWYMGQCGGAVVDTAFHYQPDRNLLHVVFVSEWVPSRGTSFFPQSGDMQVRLIGESVACRCGCGWFLCVSAVLLFLTDESWISLSLTV